MDIELWFQPTYDDLNLARPSTLSELCDSVIAFYLPLLSQKSNILRDRFAAGLSNADCVHINRFSEVVTAIKHHRILWDIDELPVQFRDRPGSNPPSLADSEKTHFRRVKDAWSKSRVVFTSSPVERRADLADPVVVPNTHSRSTSIQRKPSPNSLLFVGNFNHGPNVDGIIYFASEILPLLRPQITLTIVGRKPIKPELRARLDQLRENERVEFFYDVASCAPFFDRSMVAIAPIRFGGGTRLKILEAFAAKCPVVSTEKGCEGLAVTHEKELLIVDTPAAFASACTRLLDNAVLNRDLAKSAYKFFENNCSQKVVDNILKSVLDEVLMTGA